jgi:hypothetical protein
LQAGVGCYWRERRARAKFTSSRKADDFFGSRRFYLAFWIFVEVRKFVILDIKIVYELLTRKLDIIGKSDYNIRFTVAANLCTA